MLHDRRWLGTLGVLGGLIATQFVLFGPSLVGSTILLPLDILAFHLPQGSVRETPTGVDFSFGDLVLVDEVMRVHAAREIRQGVIPLWDPHNFAGAPFVANNVSAVFSPYRVLDYLFPAPTTLAWGQMLRAMVAGLGAYIFFRRALQVRYWPAAVGAWSFPLCGYLVLWCGYGSSAVVSWLPWMLLAVHESCRARPWGGPALALCTAFVLLSGHMADGGQVLIASGLYAIWFLTSHLGRHNASRAARFAALATLLSGWLLGFLLASPQLLPTLEYAQYSRRMLLRNENMQERPALGLAAVPQIAVPAFYGTRRVDQVYQLPGFQQESAAAGYAGLIVLFVLAPLAFAGVMRKEAMFWLFAAIVGAAETLGVPGFHALVSLPVLRLMTFNRMMFLTAFSIVTLGVLGLESLCDARFRWRSWMWIPPGLAIALATWSVLRVAYPHEGVASASSDLWLTFTALPPWFLKIQLATILLSLVAIVAWLCLRAETRHTRWMRWALPAVLLGELLWNSYGVNAQCDPSQYYPADEVLDQFAKLPAGRICGELCFPPMLNEMYGLHDVRGYDGLDPRYVVELLLSDEPRLDPEKRMPLTHAMTVFHAAPLVSPIHDLLGVRYLLFGDKRPKELRPLVQRADSFYSIVERTTALPHCFVPHRVVPVRDERATMRLMHRAGFDPRETAYVDAAELGEQRDCEGTAVVVRESSNEIAVAYDMRTDGLVVLADAWFPGWRAYVAGKEVPIFRTDYAVRGVAVKAGSGEIVFRYEPAGFWLGVKLCAAAAMASVAWLIAGCAIATLRRRKAAITSPAASESL